MPVKFKMIATVVVVTLLLVLLGVITHLQVLAYERLSASRYQVAEIETHMLELRRHEKDFLARRDNAYVDKFDATYGEVEAHLGELDTLLAELAIASTAVDRVRAGGAAYRGLFDDVVRLQHRIGLHAKDGLYGRLREAVHDAEAIFKALGDFELTSHMLMLRRAEKDFMLRRDTKYLDKFDNSFGSMQAALTTAAMAGDVRAQASGFMDAYRAGFLALVDAERELGLSHKDGALGELRKTVHAVEAELQAFEAELGTQIAAASSRIDVVLYGALAAIILAVAAWLSWLGWSISHRASQVAHNMCAIAQGDGDLTRRMDVGGGDEFADLASAFNEFAGKIHDMLKRIAGMSTVLSETTSKVSEAAGATDDSMQRLRGNTQAVVVATEEMSATAREVATGASRVAASSSEADSVAVQGRETVEQSIASINTFAREFDAAASTITSLRAETDNIGGILDVIRSIAEQTNLLALNAAIEAARAGEQGRGFAVVADEVRTLAHRSQQSTSEIQDLIVRLQEQAESAVGMIEHGQARIGETVAQAGQAGEALARITDAIGTINGMTTQIATAAEEQSAVVADISGNVVEIDQLAQGTTAHADTTTDLAGRLAEAMAGVTHELKHFRFENDELLVLSQAKAAHFDWKGRLRSFLDGHSELSSQQVASHEHCDLGKWYYAEGMQRFGASADFKAIEPPHREIHQAIREVVEAKERGDMRAAEQGYARVQTLSDQVVASLDRLADSLK
ncbi:MAG: methyl-accepting chemotaxis protein [Gammaproteobacteria bacterium]|nr:methyl-accepting chemotaxis protein [Gammaproteobacteria bacterium]